jgi:hypothetical protein
MATTKTSVLPAAQPQRLDSQDILTPEQLAERLKLPVSWVYKQTARRGSNSLPVLRCGRYLRFSWPDVCNWLRSRDAA